MVDLDDVVDSSTTATTTTTDVFCRPFYLVGEPNMKNSTTVKEIVKGLPTAAQVCRGHGRPPKVRLSFDRRFFH